MLWPHHPARQWTCPCEYRFCGGERTVICAAHRLGKYTSLRLDAPVCSTSAPPTRCHAEHPLAATADASPSLSGVPVLPLLRDGGKYLAEHTGAPHSESSRTGDLVPLDWARK